MSRLSKEERQVIMDEHGVNILRSYSMISALKECSWFYKLNYIDRIRLEDSHNFWSYLGSVCGHDIIQDMTDKKHSYEDMVDIFDKITNQFILEDKPNRRFPNMQYLTSEQGRDRWIANMRHYFANTDVIPHDIKNEELTIIVFQGKYKHVFQGWIDAMYTDDEGNTVILDYKSSGINGFSGAELIEKSYQLFTYALGIHQQTGIPLDKIRAKFDMQKYVTITYPLAKPNIKGETHSTINAERRKWVESISGRILKDFQDVHKAMAKCDEKIAKINEQIEKKYQQKTPPKESVMQNLLDKRANVLTEKEELGYNLYDMDEAESMIGLAIKNNHIDKLPLFIREKYIVSNCYIEAPITKENIQAFKDDMIKTLDKLVELERAEKPDEMFKREPIDKASFYCQHLCSLKEHCKYFENYRNKRDELYGQSKREELKLTFNELFGITSSNNSNNNKSLW